MNGCLAVQLIAFVAFVAFVLDALIQAVIKRIFPTWSRGVCVTGAGFIVGVALFSTVPGRARHLEFVKQLVMDEVAAKEFNGGGTGIGSWFGNTVSGFAVDLFLQGMRVEKYCGLVSVGYMEADCGWTPVTVGFAGVVCRNFFIAIPNYETPQVNVTIEKDAEGTDQIVLHNLGDAKYECAVYMSSSGVDSPLRKFSLAAQSTVRIQQEKKGLGNKLKNLLNGGKALVTIPEPLSSVHSIMFMVGKRKLKRAVITQVEGKGQACWGDPR